MTEKELRKQLRELAQEMWDQSAEDFYVGDDDKKMVRAYMLLESAHRITRLLIDDEQPDPLKEHHPEVAKWYEKHGEKPAAIPVFHGPDASNCPRCEADKAAPSSVGVHTCYEGCTHPAHEGAPVPPIGTEPLADPDDAHTERVTVEQMVEKALAPIAEEHRASLDGGPVNEVWSHYVSAHPDHKTCRLTAPRKRMIQARLKEGYTVEQLKDAITGFHLSPFHTGENDQKKRYLEFELMVRSGEQVEKGLGCLRDARQSPVAAGPTSAEIAAKEAEISATVAAAAAQVVPPPPAPPANEVEFL